MDFRDRLITDLMHLKRPEFDKAEQVYLGSEPILQDVSIDIGDRVIVRYKGYDVHMFVKEKHNDTEFVGRIYGFELVIRNNCRDLFLEKEVIFEKKHVCVIFKKTL
jgi:hypothetical protein